jgi:hypothetical protein
MALFLFYLVFFALSSWTSWRVGAMLDNLKAGEFASVPPAVFARWRNHRLLSNWGLPVALGAGTVQAFLEANDMAPDAVAAIRLAMMGALGGVLFLWISYRDIEKKHGIRL